MLKQFWTLQILVAVGQENYFELKISQIKLHSKSYTLSWDDTCFELSDTLN